jgi:tol-pal system protein YbgF
MGFVRRSWMRAGAVALVLAVAGSLALAQQVPPAPPSGPRPLPKAPPAAREAPPPAETGTLQRRVEQLEEQLVDLQVVIGTLESLAKGTAGAPAGPRVPVGPSAAVSAADAGRLDAIETQIRALAAQLEGLQEQVRALASRSGSADGPPPRFGSVTVEPDGPKDEMDRVMPPPAAGGPPPRAAAAPPAVRGGEADVEPQQLYEQAYGYLLQKDYRSAETGFEDFLRRHPSHQLAGNAQYWLGESFYVRGQYRAAAGAFLKGYQTYARSPKAPETLLKLAMSLQRLGQKDAACSSFNELGTKYPNPPAHVRSMAQTERQRSGC